MNKMYGDCNVTLTIIHAKFEDILSNKKGFHTRTEF